MYATLKTLLLPPANLIVLLALALIALLLGRRKTGVALTGVAMVLAFVLSAPITASFIARMVQTIPPLAAEAAGTTEAQAIVVLSAGYAHSGVEYGGRTIDATTLVRLRYAAHLGHITHLPILVSGGWTRPGFPPLADLMRAALEQDFHMPVRWVEDKSTDTRENAVFSADVLKAAGISKVMLVTHASHMVRARTVFEAQGLTVIPAPTDFAAPARMELRDFIPRISSIEESYYALYELLGQAWYALRHGASAKETPAP